MTATHSKRLLVAASLLALSWTGVASAQATRTWVSGVGDDVNPCSRTAPCKTFAGAISKTAAGGEIDVLDPAGVGTVTVTKSITLNGEYIGKGGGVLASGVTGVLINAAATDVVIIRGLDIDGAGVTPGTYGVRILQAGEVDIGNTLIKNFMTSPGYGVAVTPLSSDVKVVIDHVNFVKNGGPTGGAGVYVGPGSTAKATVLIGNSQFSGGTVGVKADGSTGTGAINVQISNSMISHSIGQGILVQSNPGAPISLVVDNSVVTDNGSPGLRVQGANATATVSRSTFTANGGPGIQAQNGGVLQSTGDNRSFLNGAADSAPVAVAPK